MSEHKEITQYWFANKKEQALKQYCENKIQLAEFKENDNSQGSKNNFKLQNFGLSSPMGALFAFRRYAAICGSKFSLKSYPLLASSQHIVATTAVSMLQVVCFSELSYTMKLTIFGEIANFC